MEKKRRRRPRVTWQQAAAQFKDNELVTTIEMGGLGPGYEQALQLLLFAIMAEWPADKPVPPPDGEHAPSEFIQHRDAVVNKHDESLGGLSGAQVAAATSIAYRFMHYGYSETIEKIEAENEDRLIMLTQDWPRLAE